MLKSNQANQKIKPKFDIKTIEKSCQRVDLPLFKNKYGNKEKQEYMFRLAIMEKVLNICKKEGWLTKQDWNNNNIPMKDLIKNLFYASEKYLDIKKYFVFMEFEKQRKAYQS